MTEIALLTKHHKQFAVSPALAKAGYEVRTISSFDTDLMGSFTREIPRISSQLDTALAKAKLATKLGRCRFGLGSEGSFGADPYLG